MTPPLKVIVRELSPSDTAEWIRLRKDLWQESTDVDAFTWRTREDVVTLVATRSSGSISLLGFAEVGTRIYADGCKTSPVGFLEGWYVEPALRKMGIGTLLIEKAVLWARARGLRELASDSLLDDATAYAAHLSIGFEEVERCVKYRLALL